MGSSPRGHPTWRCGMSSIERRSTRKVVGAGAAVASRSAAGQAGSASRVREVTKECYTATRIGCAGNLVRQARGGMSPPTATVPLERWCDSTAPRIFRSMLPSGLRATHRTTARRYARRHGRNCDPRANGITALRLGLALWVLVMHAWPAGGFGADPLEWVTGGRVDGGGSVAVWAFFGLSGFLLASSRQRLPVHAFAWRRVLRILPAYWVCIALTAGLRRLVVCGGHPQPVGLDRWPAMGWVRKQPDRPHQCIALDSAPGDRLLHRAGPYARARHPVRGIHARGGTGWDRCCRVDVAALWLPPIFAFMVGLLLATWRVPIRGLTRIRGRNAGLRGCRLTARDAGGGGWSCLRDALAGDVAARSIGGTTCRTAHTSTHFR